jgi:hypothetical protein
LFYEVHYKATLQFEFQISVKVLVGKPEGKRPFGRPRRRWEDGIRTDLREIGWGRVEWIQLAQDRDRWRAVVNALVFLVVTFLWAFPPKPCSFLPSPDIDSLSSRKWRNESSTADDSNSMKTTVE